MSTLEANLMPLIEEVTIASSSAEFRNDVQLAQYRTKNNLELARDFIFTRKATAGRKSSIELLKLICEAFMGGTPPNRFVFIATYGHGKSHFAVATANYFGKPAGSPESDGVLARVKHALQDPSLFGFFEGFKRNNKPSLILVLPGDEPSDLQTKFFRAVEESLRLDPQSGTIQAPFWYMEAERFIQGILKDGDSLKKNANAFLAQYQLDLDLLLDRIKIQEASTCDITRELCLHLYHHSPDFGTGLSLKEGVEWLGKNLVGEGKPYGGVLILFDEFSSFVRDYALRIQDRPGAPLQDLLNGVDSMRGKVAFVALAQRDPELVAKSLLSGDSLQSLTTQLNRLPKPQHYQLHSSLEEVLAAYLKQIPQSWKKLYSNPTFSNVLGQASDLCFDVFASRYSETLEWDVERFQEIVTQGCFPLHPATTALLSSVELETTNNPRSVLGFVSKHLDALRGASAFDNDKPRWILPIALVDYFKEMLGEKNWEDFSDALGQAGGPDASPEQVAVLKAMLLQTAGRVATRGSYNRVLAQFAGLSVEEAGSALKALAASGVIRFDPTKNVYTFWPAGKGANKVDQILSEKLAGSLLDSSTLTALNAHLRSEGLMPDISVTVPWGHRDDWQAEQLLASKHTFTVSSLQALVLNRMYWRPEGNPLARGLVIWLVAESPEDAALLRDSAAEVLAKAFPDQNLPIVLMKPTAAQPELARQLLRLHGLRSFTNSDIAEVGQEQHLALLQLTMASMKSGFQSLAEEAEQEVPVTFKGRINSARFVDIESVLAEVFKMAYNEGPRRWFEHYKQTSTKLRNSTARVATYLLGNALDTPKIFDADSVAKDIAQQQMKSEWGLLASDLRIKQPLATSGIRSAWDFLEAFFPAGGPSKLAGPAIIVLLNVPYGYDYNTLSLILAAWFGFHRHDLEISLNGQLRPLKTFANQKPKEFLELVANVSVRKTDADVVREQVRKQLERVERGSFSQIEAQETLQLFSEALERDDVDQKNAIQSASGKLAGALERAEQYDRIAGDIEKLIENQRNLVDLSRVLNRVGSLNVPEAVRPEKPAPSELRARLLQRIKSVTESNCDQYKQLQSISSFDLNEQLLLSIRKTLANIQLLDLVELVDSALVKLNETKEQLEREQQDETNLTLIRSLEPKGGLEQLKRNISTIEDMKLFSGANRKIADEKLTCLRQEISRLQQFQTGIAGRLDSVRDARSLEPVQSDILRNQNLFEGSEEAAQLQQSLERSNRLKEFFETIESKRRETLRTPDETAQRIEELRALSAGYQAHLSTVQGDIVAGAIDDVRQEAERQSKSAVMWLEQCERQASEQKKLDELAAKLTVPPAFLPDQQQSRLDLLVEQVKRCTESKQLEAAALAALTTVSTKGSLSELNKQVAAVESLSVPTDIVRKQVQDKISALRQEVSRLQQFQAGIAARLDSVRDTRSLQPVQSDILRNQNLFEGSEEAAQLQQSLERSNRLKEFFETIESKRRETLRTPDETAQRIEELRALSAGYQAHLSTVQGDIVAGAIDDVRQEAERQSKSAVMWLEQCERQASEQKKLDELAAKLTVPPAFLPDQQQSRLESLVEQVKRCTESKQLEAAALAALTTVSTKGSLSELNKQVAAVESLSVPTDIVRKQVQDKISALRQEVSRLQQFQAGIAARLDSVRDTRSLQPVQSDILRNQNLFEGSEEAAQLQQSLERSNRLKEFFETIESKRPETLRTPKEAAQRIEELKALASGYQSQLSTVQGDIVASAIEDVRQEAERQSKSAVVWLEQCERSIQEGANPEDVAERLRTPPAFLPSDTKLRLASIVQQNKRRIDDNQTLQVVIHFKQISDVSKRIECLNQLKALVDENREPCLEK